MLTPLSMLILACPMCCGSQSKQSWAPFADADFFTITLGLCVTAGGFYSQLVKPGLRVVSLNTILYYGPNKVTSNMTDPAGQFEWLEKTLQKAAQSLEKVESCLNPALWSASHCCMLGISSKEVNVASFLLQVYIIAHVPVGYLPFVRNTTAVRELHNERLVAICRRYSSVIVGHFYGHTHRDSIMVLLDQQGEQNVIMTIIKVFLLSPTSTRAGCFGFTSLKFQNLGLIIPECSGKGLTNIIQRQRGTSQKAE